MSTLPPDITKQVHAVDVRFYEDTLIVVLNDGREIRVPIERIKWLRWLAQATPEQRSKWSLEPGGFAIYWDELDDGIEIGHLLGLYPLS